MVPATTVRHGRSNDTEGVQRAYARSWREAYRGILPETALEAETADPAEFYPREKYRAKIEADDAVYLVAVTDGEIAGVAHFTWGEANTHEFVEPGGAQLRAIYVDPAYWGQGVGTELLDAGLDRLPPATDELTVECLTANDRARQFYESRDFDRKGGRTIELFGGDYDTAVYRLTL